MHVNKWYGQFHVLKDINLTCARASVSCCAAVGFGQVHHHPLPQPPGRAPAGRIVVDGVELTNDLKQIEAIRRGSGMFQHFNLFPHLTILQNCTLAPMWVRKMPKRKAEEIAMHYLERVRIPEQAHKYPGQLSGGQQQRGDCPRAVHETENHAVRRTDLGAGPGNGQGGARHHDRPGRRRHDHALRTHEMGFARTVADRVIFMDKGEIVEQAAPDDFFDNPQNDRTKLFLSQILH
jgi:general L-amino acid transport system ATP-binding protein